MKRKLCFLYFLFSFLWAQGEVAKSSLENNISNGPPTLGNFALPPSQQPGSFLSFGQNIVSKNTTLLYLNGIRVEGKNQHTFDVVPNLVYGITNTLSLNVITPIAASYTEDEMHSSGLEDSFLQFEYAFYRKDTRDYSDQATLVTNVSFPTGSTNKQPHTGFGSSSFFVGTTLTRLYVNWFGFTSEGTTQTTSKNNTKFGNQYFYQLGIGRNIFSIPNKLITAWLLEFNGQYFEKDRISGFIQPDSGGNIIFITPSLWLSTNKIIFQAGAGAPVMQHLYGHQNKSHYLLAANLGWTL